MTVTTKPARIRPTLPRLVDQMRILLWFQFYLLLLSAIPSFIYGAIMQGQQEQYYGDIMGWEIFENRATAAITAGFATVGVGVLSAICAGLVRRRKVAVVLYPLVLATEALVIVVLARDVRDGLYAGLGAVLSLALGGWILVDLFRGETLAYVFRRAPLG
jgi:hypothetical protein